MQAVQYDLVELTTGPAAGTGAVVAVTTPAGAKFTLATTAGGPAGGFTAYFTPEEVGDYELQWAFPDGHSAADTLTVIEFEPTSLFTLEDAYLSLNMPSSKQGADAKRDADMLDYLAAAADVVEGIWGPLTPRTITQRFDGGKTAVLLSVRPRGILAVIENGVPIWDWVPDMPAGIIYAGTFGASRPFWPGRQNVTVRYSAGSANPPANVRLAVREEFRFLWQLGRSGQHPALAESVQSEQATPQGFAIPNRVYELLSTSAEPSLPGFA